MWTYQHNNFCVHQIPVLNDNYIYLVDARQHGILAVIDPALAEPVQQACEILAIPLTHILNTHHHWDHTDGNLTLKETYHCQIIGAKHDAQRIPGIDIQVDESSSFDLNGLNISVLDIPGHTTGHIAFIIEDALFCGDTLFGAGCGRLFEGTPKQMWHSLSKLATLSGDTQVYCAHEYTLPNLRFARSISPDNQQLQTRISNDTRKRRQKLPTIPSSIKVEKQTNPFLWPLDTGFCESYANKHNIKTVPESIFAHLRDSKDRW